MHVVNSANRGAVGEAREELLEILPEANLELLSPDVPNPARSLLQ